MFVFTATSPVTPSVPATAVFPEAPATVNLFVFTATSPATPSVPPTAAFPVVVKFLTPATSLFASVTIDFDASTVPGVVTSRYNTSAEVTSDMATFPWASVTTALEAVRVGGTGIASICVCIFEVAPSR